MSGSSLLEVAQPLAISSPDAIASPDPAVAQALALLQQLAAGAPHGQGSAGSAAAASSDSQGGTLETKLPMPAAAAPAAAPSSQGPNPSVPDLLQPLAEALKSEVAAAAAAAEVVRALSPASQPPAGNDRSDSGSGSPPSPSASADGASSSQTLLQPHDQRVLGGCRMARAVCVAGRVGALAQAGAPALLLAHLTSPATADVVRAACAEALTSAALRSPCAGDTVVDTPGAAEQLVASVSPQQPVSGEPQPERRLALPSMLRLLITLSHHRRAFAVLLRAGMLPALVAVAAGGQAAARVSQGGMAEDSGAPAAPVAAAPTPAAIPTAARQAALLFLLNLSSSAPFHAQLIRAGILPGLLPLLQPAATPVQLLEPAAAVYNNISLGGAPQQDAVLACGAVPRLARLLGHPHTPVVCHSVDALANTMLNHPGAQAAFGAARCALPGGPAALGRGSSGAAAAGPADSGEVAAAGQSGQQHPQGVVVMGGVQALVRLLSTSRSPVVLSKGLRALSNALVGNAPCTANQQAALATGVVPLLVALLAVRSAPVVRQALGVLANLCLGFPPGMQAVMRAGAGPAALALLQPHHHHHSQVAGAGGSASAGGAAEAGGGGASAGGGTGGGGSPIVLSGSDGEGGSSRENSSGGEDKGAGAARQRHRSSSGAGASTSTGTLIEDTGVGSPTSGTPPRLPSPEPEGHDAHSGAADASSSSPAAGETAVSPAAAAPSVAERACLLLANLASGGRASKEALLGAGAVPALLCHLRGAVPQLLAEAAEASTSSSGLASAGAQAAGSSSIGRKALAVRQQRAAAAAAAAAALANLCLREPAAGAQLASAGGVGLLAALLTPEVQAVHPEVVARVAHALGSAAAAGCAACQDALLEPLPPFNAASTAADSAAGPQEPAGTSSSTSGTGSSALERLVGLARVRPPVPAVLPEVLRALGNAAQAHGRGREALRRAGGLDALVAALQVGHMATLRAALLAVVSAVDRCPASQAQFVSLPGAPAALVRLLAVRQPEVAGLACFTIHALSLHALSPATHAPGAGAGSGAGLVDAVASTAMALAAPEDMSAGQALALVQATLAEAGALPALVRLLQHPSPEVADKAVMGLCGLVRGNRANQVATAAAGGIAPLAALIEPRPSSAGGAAPAAPARGPLLSRHVIDTWIELGGLPALVKLLSHRHPAVVELAARKVGAAASGTAAGIGSGVPVAGGNAGSGAQARGAMAAALLKAGAGPALLRVARAGASGAGAARAGAPGGPSPSKAAEAALEALNALAGAGEAARAALVGAGALDTMRALVGAAQALAAAAASSSSPAAGAAGAAEAPAGATTTAAREGASSARDKKKRRGGAAAGGPARTDSAAGSGGASSSGRPLMPVRGARSGGAPAGAGAAGGGGAASAAAAAAAARIKDSASHAVIAAAAARAAVVGRLAAAVAAQLSAAGATA